MTHDLESGQRLLNLILAPLFAVCLTAGMYWMLQPVMAIAAPLRSQSVQIRNFAFAPAVLNVAPGTTVTWTNGDDDPHTVTSTNSAFRSRALDTSGGFSFTFNTVGEFAYFCSLHPHMRGKIIVQAS